MSPPPSPPSPPPPHVFTPSPSSPGAGESSRRRSRQEVRGESGAERVPHHRRGCQGHRWPSSFPLSPAMATATADAAAKVAARLNAARLACRGWVAKKRLRQSVPHQCDRRQ